MRIPYQNILEVDYKMPSFHLATGKMKLTFYDSGGYQGSKQSLKRRTMQISVAGTGHVDAQNALTGRAADIIRMRCEQRDISIYEKIVLDSLPASSLSIPLDNPSVLSKFWYGLSLFAGLLLLGLIDDSGFFFFLGIFLFFPTLIALAIDYIRLQTDWPFLFKLFAGFIAFIVGFLLMLLTFGILVRFGMW